MALYYSKINKLEIFKSEITMEKLPFVLKTLNLALDYPS